MSFAVHAQTHADVSGLDPTIYVLEDGDGGRAEVWPALGFNCYRWQVQRGGQALELLYQDPNLFNNGRPTRSGIPVLFPFPNRIRDGRFTWDGRTYQLPIDDPAKKNAIHGFACRHPWRSRGFGSGYDECLDHRRISLFPGRARQPGAVADGSRNPPHLSSGRRFAAPGGGSIQSGSCWDAFRTRLSSVFSHTLHVGGRGGRLSADGAGAIVLEAGGIAAHGGALAGRCVLRSQSATALRRPPCGHGPDGCARPTGRLAGARGAAEVRQGRRCGCTGVRSSATSSSSRRPIGRRFASSRTLA